MGLKVSLATVCLQGPTGHRRPTCPTERQGGHGGYDEARREVDFREKEGGTLRGQQQGPRGKRV